MPHINKFPQRKQAVLSKPDKSHIGEWDKKIAGLCDKINSKENYYTTSSCSGRIVLMIDHEKKTPGLFLAVSHDLINFNWLTENLIRIISSQPARPDKKTAAHFSSQKFNKINNLKSCLLSINSINNLSQKAVKAINSKNIRANNFAGRDFIYSRIKLPGGIAGRNKFIKFKCEPPIIHVVCRNLQSASELLEKAKSSGMKHSGMHSLGKNIILEINGSDRLEFPVIGNGKILVNDKFLRITIKQANKKLKKGWKNLKNLENSIK